MLQSFITTNCILETGQKILSSQLYNYSIQNLFPDGSFILSNKAFTQYIRRNFPDLVLKHTHAGSTWMGITLKETYTPVKIKSKVKTPQQVIETKLKSQTYQHNYYLQNKEKKAQQRQARKSRDLDLIQRCGLDQNMDQIVNRYRYWKPLRLIAYEYHVDGSINWVASVSQTLENRRQYKQKAAEIQREQQQLSADIVTHETLPVGVPDLRAIHARRQLNTSNHIDSQLDRLKGLESFEPLHSRSESDSRSIETEIPKVQEKLFSTALGRTIRLKIRGLPSLISLQDQIRKMTTISSQVGQGSPSPLTETKSIAASDLSQEDVRTEPCSALEVGTLIVEEPIVSHGSTTPNSLEERTIETPLNSKDLDYDNSTSIILTADTNSQILKPKTIINSLARSSNKKRQRNRKSKKKVLVNKPTVDNVGDITKETYAQLKNKYMRDRDALTKRYQELSQMDQTQSKVRKEQQQVEKEILKLVREWGQIREPRPEIPNLRSSKHNLQLMDQVDREHDTYIDWYSQEEDRLNRGYVDHTMYYFLEDREWIHQVDKKKLSQLQEDFHKVEMLYQKWCDETYING